VNVDAVPVELRERAQWVVWRSERRSDGKWTKVPYRAVDAHTKASATNPHTWAPFERALAVPAADAQGVGFVFSAEDPYTGVDFDDCIDVTTGELHPAVAEILEALGGYQERSPSGRGIHAIVIGTVPGDRHKTADTPWGGMFEIYDRGRYFTVTGDGSGVPVESQEQVDALYVRMWGEPSSNGARPEPEPEPDGPARELTALLKLGKIRRTVKRDGTPPGDGSASAWDFFLACEARRCGCSLAEFALLLKQARGDDAKSGRADYVEGTWRGAGEEVDTEGEKDPARRLTHRYGLRDDPIVSGEMRDPIVYLTQRSGRVLRLPNIDALFEPNNHSRIVSRIAKTQFARLTGPEAVEFAQLIIALCPSDDVDPLDETRHWPIDFTAEAGKIIESRGSPWDTLAECERLEQTLQSRRSAAARSVVIRDRNGELWLPAGALREHSGARLTWPEFTARLQEIGWRHKDVDVRAPGTRAERDEGKTGRIHRNFYVGRD
jgi:hypothetical protein